MRPQRRLKRLASGLRRIAEQHPPDAPAVKAVELEQAQDLRQALADLAGELEVG